MIKVIPAQPGDSAGAAKKCFSAALADPKTTFLLFRSTTNTEKDTDAVATKADQLAGRQNPAEWRVIWIKDASLLPSTLISQYFGDDESITVVSLRWGTGEPREVKAKFKLSDLPDRTSIGKAFAAAGPQPKG